MDNAITITSQGQALSTTPAPDAGYRRLMPWREAEILQVERLAHAYALAMKPKRLSFDEAKAQNLIKILWGAERGLEPIQSMDILSIIDGKTTISADGMAGLAHASPHCEWMRVTSHDLTHCTYEIKRVGDPEPHIVTYTKDDAERAQLWGKMTRQGYPTNWVKYPLAMLKAACLRAAMRQVFPDVLAGVYTTEEMRSARDTGRPIHQTTRPPQPQRAPVLDVVPESVKPQPVAPPVYPEEAPLLGRFLALFDGLLRDGQVMDLYDHYYDVDLTTVGEEYLRTEGKALQDDRTELERRVAAYRVGKSLSAPPPAMGPVAEPAPQEAPGSLAGEAHRLLSELAQLREAASIDALIDLYVKEGPDLTRAPLDVIRQEVLIRRTIATKGQPSSDVAPIPAPAQESLLPAQPKVDTAAEWRRAFDAIVACFDGHSGKSVMSIFKVDDVDLNACTTERLRWIHRQLDPGTVQGLIGRSMGTTTEVQSSSDPDVSYTVTERGGAYSCTCDGYRYRQACRHIDKVKGAGSE